MATRAEVFGVLAAASGPLSREQLGEQVGQPVREWQKQLKGWIDNGLIEDTGDQHFVITEKGRKETLPEDHEGLDAGGLKEVRDIARDSITMTDREKFIQLGIDAGMTNKGFLKGTANLVWNRGDPRDLDSVWAGLKEANIDRDIASRWFNFWAAHIRKSIPINVTKELSYNIGPKDKSDKDKTSLSHNIDEDGNPVYVGEGQGALTHDEAFELAKIKAGAATRRNVSPPASAASQIEEVGKAFATFKEMMGEKAAGKSYVVKPGEDGYQIEEVDPNKPILIPQSIGAKQSPSYYVDSDGAVKELLPGQPVVIIKEAPKQTSPSTQYLIDKSTGEVKEVAPGQPVIIIQGNTPVSQAQPIQMTDKDGKPMILDLSTYIKLEEHRDKTRREEDSHETKMEIAKGFKDLLNKAGKALTHMAEEEKE